MNDNTIHLLFSANRWEGSAEMERMLSSGTTLVSCRGSHLNLFDVSIHIVSYFNSNVNFIKKVCDRYCYSGVAFSAAKGMDMDWCKACDKGLIAPDCVIYLDMPVEEAAQVGKLQLSTFLQCDSFGTISELLSKCVNLHKSQFYCQRFFSEFLSYIFRQRGNFGEERYEKIDFQLKVREKFMELKKEDEGRLPWFFLDARKSIEDLKEEIKLIGDQCVRDSANKPFTRMF